MIHSFLESLKNRAKFYKSIEISKCDFKFLNELKKQPIQLFFQSHKLARTIVAVKEIHFGFKVAIEAMDEKPS